MAEDHNWINYLDRNYNWQYKDITSNRTYTHNEVIELIKKFENAPNNYVFNTIGVEAEPSSIKYTYKYDSTPVFNYIIKYKENNDDEEYDVGSFEDIL